MNAKPIESTDKEALNKLLGDVRVLDVLAAIDIQELLGHVPSGDRLEENMRKNGGRLRRLQSGKRKGPDKRELKRRAKARRMREAKYARDVKIPRRTQWTLTKIREEGAGGWWDLIRRKGATSWSEKPGWRIGKEEFVKAVGNSLDGSLPVVGRYDTARLWTLDNIIIRDSETRAVLFDGKEHKLKSLGYCL